MRELIVLGLILAASGLLSRGASFYPTRLDDPKAVYLEAGQFGAKGDGMADDSAAVQAAVDKVQETTREGIVFIQEGRYRVTRTIYVWPGVRLIGYGGKRPVFVLAGGTPGFQQGIGCMFFFAGGRRQNGGPLRAGVSGCRIRRRERFRQIRRSSMPIRARSIPP